ncbi:MAG: hypothetical protein A4E29_01502 [Methanomassiliicoccales archaeon PtaB.Bin134]|nr:MAG: hypothetical protein A4E29_01502 [Methanomassiliicoccales archaeon PtaB.Bin134]
MWPKYMPRNAKTRPSNAALSSRTTVYRLGSFDSLKNSMELFTPFAWKNCLIAIVKEELSINMAIASTMYAAVGSPRTVLGVTSPM